MASLAIVHTFALLGFCGWEEQDKWAIREVEGFAPIYFRRLGRVKGSQLFRFLLPFALALSDLQAPLELWFCCPYF
jgi:hypothetical protein